MIIDKTVFCSNCFLLQVIAVVGNHDEASIVSQFHPHLCKFYITRATLRFSALILLFDFDTFWLLDKVIDMSAVKDFTETCLHETGGLGVSCVIDSGGQCHFPAFLSIALPNFFLFSPVSPGYLLSDFIIESPFVLQQLKQEARRYESETNLPSSPSPLPSKHQIISILAAQGHWVTSQPDLQVTFHALIHPLRVTFFSTSYNPLLDNTIHLACYSLCPARTT